MGADLDAIRARLKAATPGPWSTPPAGDDCTGLVTTNAGSFIVADSSCNEDADLIAHAPADLAALCDEVEALRAALADRDDDTRRVLAEDCAPDERHCSCVPALRAEVAHQTRVANGLRVALGNMATYADAAYARGVEDERRAVVDSMFRAGLHRQGGERG